VHDALYVNIATTQIAIAVISVFNTSGSQVLLQQENIAPGNNSFTITETGKLPTGNYILSIKLDSGETFTEKFSKQ
jgi:hypothetical protein